MKQQPAPVAGARWIIVGRSGWALVDEADYDSVTAYSWCKTAGYAGRMIRATAWRNLRLASQSQNLSNRGKQKNNTSGFKGVHLHKPSGLWTAKITKNGKTNSLGYFKTPEEAAVAYKVAAKRLHGEFARTN